MCRSAAELRADPSSPRPQVWGGSGAGAAHLARRRAPPLPLLEEPGPVGDGGKNSLAGVWFFQSGQTTYIHCRRFAETLWSAGSAFRASRPALVFLYICLGADTPRPPLTALCQSFFCTAVTSVDRPRLCFVVGRYKYGKRELI